MTTIEEETIPEPSTPEKGDKPNPVKRGKSWIIWLLIILGIAAFQGAWLLLPEPSRIELASFFARFAPDESSNQKQHTAMETPGKLSTTNTEAPVTQAEKKPVAIIEHHSRLMSTLEKTNTDVMPTMPKTLTDTQATTNASPAAQSVVNTQNILALTDEIRKLRAEIRTWEQAQIVLRQSIEMRQKVDMRRYLRHIMDQHSDFTQRANTWQEMAMLSVLTVDQRKQAQRMAQLAETDAGKLILWRGRIKGLIHALPEPRPERDMIPQSDNTAFAWLGNQFHIRRAPVAAQTHITKLRMELITISDQLAADIWPDDQTWHRLLTRLRTRLGNKNQRLAGLPESFATIRTDLENMRILAKAWMQDLGNKG